MFYANSGELHAGQAPWMPEAPFFEENRETIGRLFAQIAYDFPESHAANVLDPDQAMPTADAMNWMWSRLMGRQHGSQEGFDGKIPLTRDMEAPYWPLISELHYGDYGFTDAHPGNPAVHYTNVLGLGGEPGEMIRIMRAAINDDVYTGNIDNLTVMAGQRLRWDVPDEATIAGIYAAVARETGVDIDKLRELSPWLRAEERKTTREGDPWSGPFATELELARLAVEATYIDVIDWKNYGPEVIIDPKAAEQTYSFRGETKVVPPREVAMYGYDLTTGTRVSVLNGKAVPRALGVPRPTSTSQAEEMVDLGLVGGQPENIAVGVVPPHIRGGIDVTIRLMSLVGDAIEQTSIINPSLHSEKEALAGLGEIPATHKADMRLRALLAGKDPDAPELANL